MLVWNSEWNTFSNKSIRCWAVTASFSTKLFNISCTAWLIIPATSADGSSRPCLAVMDFNLACIKLIGTRYSSLHDLICVPIISVDPRILWVSSAKLTPPIAATSFISSSPAILSSTNGWLNWSVDFFSFSLRRDFPAVRTVDNAEDDVGLVKPDLLFTGIVLPTLVTLSLVWTGMFWRTAIVLPALGGGFCWKFH